MFSLFLCPCCISCTKKTEKELPENELWQLCRSAFEQYKSEITNGEKSYHRYVNDFVYYHLPAYGMNEVNMRTHVQHVCTIRELLEERRDLVEEFFSNDIFEETDYQQMFSLFNSGQNIEPLKDYLAHFSDKQIMHINEFVTATSLFRAETTEEIIKNMFECRLEKPLQANNNRNVALFFGALRDYGLLPFRWQMIIERNKLIASSTNNEALRASQMRCSLSQAKKSKLCKKNSSDQKDYEVGFEYTCKSFVKRLKECM